MIDDKTYKLITDNVPIACVDIAIVHEGNCLLVKRLDEPKEWWIPGGRIHKRELLHEAAARKCREEVGLDCKIGPVIYAGETMFQCGIHTLNFCMKAEINDYKGISLDDHHSEYKWVSSIDDTLHPYVQTCLRKAL